MVRDGSENLRLTKIYYEIPSKICFAQMTFWASKNFLEIFLIVLWGNCFADNFCIWKKLKLWVFRQIFLTEKKKQKTEFLDFENFLEISIFCTLDSYAIKLIFGFFFSICHEILSRIYVTHTISWILSNFMWLNISFFSWRNSKFSIFWPKFEDRKKIQKSWFFILNCVGRVR